MEFIFKGAKNIVGKGKKCWSPAFSPLPTTRGFSIAFFFRILKNSKLCGEELILT